MNISETLDPRSNLRIGSWIDSWKPMYPMQTVIKLLLTFYQSWPTVIKDIYNTPTIFCTSSLTKTVNFFESWRKTIRHKVVKTTFGLDDDDEVTSRPYWAMSSVIQEGLNCLWSNKQNVHIHLPNAGHAEYRNSNGDDGITEKFCWCGRKELCLFPKHIWKKFSEAAVLGFVFSSCIAHIVNFRFVHNFVLW